MAKPRDLLRRFRLIAVPGRAGMAGVPADRESALREELAPVFAVLQQVERDADSLVARAQADSEDRHARAGLEVARILRETREALPSERSRAAADVTSRADFAAETIRANARKEIERIQRNASEQLPLVTNELVRRVMSIGHSAEASR